MKTRLSPLLLGLALVLSQVAAAPAFADDGTASGKLTVGGKTTPLTHAYALARKDTFNPAKERIFIILSDVPVPAETLWDDFPGVKLAAAGQLHAVEVEVNADKSISSSAVVHGAFADSQSFQGTPAPAFAVKTFSATNVEGTFTSGKQDDPKATKIEYTATFHAPVLHRPAPTASGAAVAQTAPGKVVLAFVKAAAAGDKAALKKLMTADYSKPLDGPNSKAILAQWKANPVDPAKTPFGTASITGNAAEVVMVDKSTEAMTAKFNLVLVAGEWKIDGAMM
jgi:hypothetical protein